MSLKLGDEAKKRAMLELAVFDQSQQLQALTESRHQAEQQQLAETPSEEPGVTNSILTQHIEIRRRCSH